MAGDRKDISSGRRQKMRLAIVHDYLIQMGGAERLIAALVGAFPDAPIYTSATDYEALKAFPQLLDRDIRNSWMQGLPGIRRHFKAFFPMYPFAFRSFSPVDADVVLVSSSGFSKWIRVEETAKTVCYCYTPPRFFWYPDDYLERELKSPLLREMAAAILRILRDWDYQCARKMDRFVAVSRYIQQRILDCYGRDSTVIYPPVNVDRFSATAKFGDYYLVLARLVGYRRIDVAVRAFNQLGEKLLIVGDGPDRAHLESLAGPNISFLGRVSDQEAKEYLENCRALIFPGLEDFGTVSLEALAAGRPVVAYGAGIALETLEPEVTAVLFEEQTAECLAEAVLRSQKLSWDSRAIREKVLSFSRERFLQEMKDYVETTHREGSLQRLGRESQAPGPGVLREKPGA
jgi:glycosyltransferase involved in cell wall biosynthesis